MRRQSARLQRNAANSEDEPTSSHERSPYDEPRKQLEELLANDVR